MDNCVIEAKSYLKKKDAEAYCSCSMTEVMKLYSNPENIDDMTDEEFDMVMEQCLLAIMENGNNPFLEWNEETKNEFIIGCEGELEGTDIDAKKYCPCALEEVIRLCPTPFEAMNMTEEILLQIAEKCMIK